MDVAYFYAVRSLVSHFSPAWALIATLKFLSFHPRLWAACAMRFAGLVPFRCDALFSLSRFVFCSLMTIRLGAIRFLLFYSGGPARDCPNIAGAILACAEYHMIDERSSSEGVLKVVVADALARTVAVRKYPAVHLFLPNARPPAALEAVGLRPNAREYNPTQGARRMRPLRGDEDE